MKPSADKDVAVPSDITLDDIDTDSLPEHIAVIMDGNGRWATQRGLIRSAGHKAGVEGIRELIKGAVKLSIPYVTIYAFSTENWSRPKSEVNTLMGLFAKTLVKEMSLLQEEGISIKLLGDIDLLPDNTRETLLKGEEETSGNNNLVLGIALNYGGRAEIIRATKNLAQKCVDGELSVDAINERLFERELYTWPAPHPDLVIRTSGEERLSNFLLWQVAYAEFISLDVLWPDFTQQDLLYAVYLYQNRERRYGGAE